MPYLGTNSRSNSMRAKSVPRVESYSPTIAFRVFKSRSLCVSARCPAKVYGQSTSFTGFNGFDKGANDVSACRGGNWEVVFGTAVLALA